jgi:hypothetical protein
MKKTTALLLIVLSLNVSLFAQDKAGEVPVSLANFYPDSDVFFANEFQNAFSKFSSFFFFTAFGDLLYIPDGAKAVKESSSSDTVVRMAASVGGLFPLTDNFSGIASATFVGDSPYIAQSWNLFAGAGVYAHHEVFGTEFGLGVFAGYFRDSYQELPKDASGYYTGLIDEQTAEITNAVRFMIAPRIGLSEKVFFLDDLRGSVNISENVDTGSVLGNLAFKKLRAMALNFGMDLYYKQNRYNLFMEDKIFGGKISTRYFSVDVGYRWFINSKDIEFLSNFQDGIYGKFIGRIPLRSLDLVISYGFERTFDWMHYIGLGVSLPVEDWTLDYLYEFSGQNMHISGVNLADLSK